MDKLTQRQAEPGLGTCDDLVGEHTAHGLAEDELRFASAELECIREALGEGDEIRIEEWHADLDAVGHGHLVGVVEVMVREKVGALEVQHQVKTADAGRQSIQGA